MGQKVNPKALRLKGVQKFENNWFSLKNYAVFLQEDVKVRQFINERLPRAPISQVFIKRKGKAFNIIDIHIRDIIRYWYRYALLQLHRLYTQTFSYCLIHIYIHIDTPHSRHSRSI